MQRDSNNADVQTSLPLFTEVDLDETDDTPAQPTKINGFPRPIIKWAGGKRSLLDEILPKLPIHERVMFLLTKDGLLLLVF